MIHIGKGVSKLGANQDRKEREKKINQVQVTYKKLMDINHTFTRLYRKHLHLLYKTQLH